MAMYALCLRFAQKVLVCLRFFSSEAEPCRTIKYEREPEWLYFLAETKAIHTQYIHLPDTSAHAHIIHRYICPTYPGLPYIRSLLA